jgi:hypothetical protein
MIYSVIAILIRLDLLTLPIALDSLSRSSGCFAVSLRTSVTQNQSKNTSSKEITADQAANIALKYGKKFEPNARWSIGSVGFVPAGRYGNTPNYMVELSNNAPFSPGIARAMDVRVNALTGSIMG